MKKLSNEDKKGLILMGISAIGLVTAVLMAYTIDKTGVSKEWFLIGSMSYAGLGLFMYIVSIRILRL